MKAHCLLHGLKMDQNGLEVAEKKRAAGKNRKIATQALKHVDKKINKLIKVYQPKTKTGCHSYFVKI